jgi:ParB family chromosome partitioning protein
MYIIMNVMSINPQLIEAFYAEEIGLGHALLLANLQRAHQEQALAN